MKCFYHSADLDGHCSGAIIKMRYPECELIGINFGDEFTFDDIEVDETVFMVDFSLQPFMHMESLNHACNLIWIDHHISAIKEHRGWTRDQEQLIIEGVRKDGIGACALVWDYCYPQSPHRPAAVQLLAEYDVWNHTDSETLPFQLGMRLEDTTPGGSSTTLWDILLSDDRGTTLGIINQGRVVLKYQTHQNQIYAEACAFETDLDGLRCIAINRMLTNSQMFDSVWDEEKYDAMLTFGWRKGQWTVSLYSTKDDVDVSVIAKNRGGGGPKGAAGFQCDTLPFAT